MSKKPLTMETRLAAYGSMSLALAAVSMPVAAQAGAVTFFVNLTTSSTAPIYFDPLTGAAGTVASSHDFELLTSVFGTHPTVGKAFLLISPNNGFANGNKFAASASQGGLGYFSVAKLLPGVTVGPNLHFSSAGAILASGSFLQAGHWNARPASGDVGLRMVDSGNHLIYGWANITVNPDYTVTLHAFGSDNTGAPVIAGTDAIPEPSSIVLLTLGAAGIAAWRRRKVNPSAE